MKARIEKDSMGEMSVPANAYYGASTMRAVQNFPISKLRFGRGFIRAIGLIKLTAAQTNVELGLLDKKIGKSIVAAADEVVDGSLDDEFVVDIFQTGSGTSTNMNANEVIANRATELLGGKLGERLIHPNDMVNMGQSSNDVIPTAIHLAGLMAIRDDLIPALAGLKSSLDQKACEFWPVIKTGRTHLQDATPIRLGQEFQGYASQVEKSLHRLDVAINELSELAIGGTAVGTGVNTHKEFASKVCSRISDILGVRLQESSAHFQAQCTLDGLVASSGSLRAVSISLMKIANDIRWLGSGPRAGLGELLLPEVQPGSSIMPGKVNPVIAESLIQVVAQVIAGDAAVAMAGQGGFFELNMMMPVAGFNFLQSIELIASAAKNFDHQCVSGLKATSKGPEMVERGLAIATALAPIVGYDKAADIAKEAAKSGRTVFEVAKEVTELSRDDLTRILDPEKMTEPGS